jgi:hypothetical protein
MAVFGSPLSVFAVISVCAPAISTNRVIAFVVFSTELSSTIRIHSLYSSDGIKARRHCGVKGISATETILNMLPSGHGVRAASSTAARLASEPSTANKIFIAFLICFRVA